MIGRFARQSGSCDRRDVAAGNGFRWTTLAVAVLGAIQAPLCAYASRRNMPSRPPDDPAEFLDLLIAVVFAFLAAFELVSALGLLWLRGGRPPGSRNWRGAWMLWLTFSVLADLVAASALALYFAF
jgi:hypothetical protein